MAEEEIDVAATMQALQERDLKLDPIDFGGETVEVVFGRSPNLVGGMPELRTGEVTVEDGILIEHDVIIEMRDGTKIFADVLRPEGATNIPAIISFAFSRQMAGVKEQGVQPGTISKWHKTESPEPMYWCHYGYAVVNVDSRGCGMSEGQASWWSTQIGQDGYDVVEWTAAQEWCNGKVGAFGNSGVAGEILQTAVQQPPHLACIAPWETTTDVYRGYLSPGGIPEVSFCSLVSRLQQGFRNQYVEDLVANRERYPYMNALWEDKIVDLEEIDVPMYCTVGWSHFHLRGSVDMFKEAGTPKKWVRMHREFEWPDDWQPENIQDLHLFFDRYLKGIHNGWEMTPRVRIDVMDSHEFDYQHNRPEKEWPLARTQYTKLYLNAAERTMELEAPAEAASTSYDSATDHAVFTHTFDEDTELTGHMKLRLWVETDGSDEMDLFCYVQKESAEGEPLYTAVIGQNHPGAMGYMRVSMRKLDEEKSLEYRPVQSFTESQPLEPGQIVPVDIEILPTSRIWHKGEKLRLMVSGRYEREPGWFEPFVYATKNGGNHIIHAGGEYDSYLLVPVIPPKFVAGDYVVR